MKEIDKLKQRPHTDCEGVPNLPKFLQHEDCCADADGGARVVRSAVQTALGLHLPSCSSLLKVLYRDSNFRNTGCLKKELLIESWAYFSLPKMGAVGSNVAMYITWKHSILLSLSKKQPNTVRNWIIKRPV